MQILRKLRWPAVFLIIPLVVFIAAYAVLEGQGGGNSAQLPVPTDGDKIGNVLGMADKEPLRKLLEGGADPNSLTTDGHLPLQLVVYDNTGTGYGKAQLLIRYGANPNKADSTGSTPMEAAAMRGTEAIMKAFIRAGGVSDLAATNGALTPYELGVVMGNDGALDAMKEALPDHVPADLKDLETTRVIHTGIWDAWSRNGEDRTTRVRRLVDGLVRDGALTAADTESMYQEILQSLQGLDRQAEEGAQ